MYKIRIVETYIYVKVMLWCECGRQKKDVAGKYKLMKNPVS